MRARTLAIAWGVWAAPWTLSPATAQEANLLPNPSFELVEPPAPTPQFAVPTEAPAELWLPRTWSLWADGGGNVALPDDPAQAHSGRRSVYATVPQGSGRVRYGAMPVPDDRPWTCRAWVRGSGQVKALAHDVTTDPWRPIREWPFDLQAEWSEISFELRPPDGCRKWMLDLATAAPGEAWIDDLLLTYAGAPELGLPPGPLERDEHTLLHLPFEEPFNEDAFFVKPTATLTEPDQGLFGRALRLGPEGYVACSANENLDPQQGTIEVWCKLLSPGNDGVAHPIIQVPGPEGMWLGKDQYAHLTFSFSTGWGRIAGTTAMSYAGGWQAGVWRHFAACWDRELLQLFVDGKLIGWEAGPNLSRALGPELGIGSPGMELDDLRISSVVRYRQPVPMEE